MTSEVPRQTDAPANSGDEVTSLQRALGAARVDLENYRAARSETIELRATIVALRTELEEQGFRMQRVVQEATGQAQEEVLELRRTVQALRDRLESERAANLAAQQELRLMAKEEQRDLQQTIVALRDRLEAAHGR